MRFDASWRDVLVVVGFPVMVVGLILLLGVAACIVALGLEWLSIAGVQVFKP
jgi:hypothetical protein